MLDKQRPCFACTGGVPQRLAHVVGDRERRDLICGAALAGDAQHRLAVIPIELLELQLTDLAHPETIQAQQQHDR